jgi:hypothetical protein
MALPRSPTPGRSPAGFTTDWPWGPMADSGYGNPFYYHQFADDFDNALGVAGLYTVSAGGAGTVAHAAGDGGLALFTTAGAASNFEAIQLPAASFTLPQGAGAGKKLFYLTRLQLSDVTNSAFIAGLCDITATPFTSITDGVWFSKASGGTVLNINSAIGGVNTATAVPASAYSLVNATNIDLGFYIDWYGNLNVFTSANMVGYVPESGTGANTPVRGRCLQVSGLSLTTANLSPTLGVQTGAAASKTMTVDFHNAQKER